MIHRIAGMLFIACTAALLTALPAVADSTRFLANDEPVARSDWEKRYETAKINGTTYLHATGSGFHNYQGSFFVEYDLSRKCSRLKATVGLADSSGSAATSTLETYLDGTRVSVQPLRLGQSFPVDLDVSGKLRLKWVAINTDSGGGQLRAVIVGDPQVTCQGVVASRVTLAASSATVTAGNGPTLSGTVTDEGGSPVATAEVTIKKLESGSSSGYQDVGQVRTDDQGKYSLVVRPDRNTRYTAFLGDGPGDGTTVIGVYTRVDIASPRPGSAGVAQSFTGRLTPGFSNVTVGLAYFPGGRFTVIGTADTDFQGGFDVVARRGLPRGTHTFVVFTSAHGGTMKGSKSVRLTVG